MSGDLLLVGSLSCLAVVLLWARLVFRGVGSPAAEGGASRYGTAMYTSFVCGTMTVAVVGAVTSLSLWAPGMVVVFADTEGVWSALASPVLGAGLVALVYGVPLSLAVGGVVAAMGRVWPRSCGPVSGTAVGFVGGLAAVVSTFPVWWCGNSTLQEVAFSTSTALTALVFGGVAAGAAGGRSLEQSHAEIAAGGFRKGE